MHYFLFFSKFLWKVSKILVQLAMLVYINGNIATVISDFLF